MLDQSTCCTVRICFLFLIVLRATLHTNTARQNKNVCCGAADVTGWAYISVTLLAGKCQHLTAYLRTIADDYALTATDSRPDASIDHGPTNSRRYEQQTDDHIGGWAANTPLTTDKYIQVQCVHRHSSTSTDSFPEGDVSQ